MTGLTHAVVGANAVWVAALVSSTEQTMWPLALVGAVAGLLPDLDAGGAKIHSIAGGVFGAFRGVFQHRGFLHSFLATMILFVASLFLISRFNPLLPIVAGFGYLSHLLVDGLNFAGVPYLFPHKRKYHLVPKFLRTPVKGFTDQLLLVLGLVGIALFFLTHYSFPISIAPFA